MPLEDRKTLDGLGRAQECIRGQKFILKRIGREVQNRYARRCRSYRSMMLVRPISNSERENTFARLRG